MNRFCTETNQTNPEQSARNQPLREFNYGPQGNEPAKRGKISLTFRLLILFIFILAAGVGVVLSLNSNEKEASAELAVQTEFRSNKGEMNVPELIEGYLNAIGGRDALREIRSVLYQGHLVSSGGEFDFFGLLLLPDKGMLVTSSESKGEVKLMLNGGTAWQVIEQRDGARRIVPLADQTTQSLQWSLRVHNSFRSLALEGRYGGLQAREIDFMGKPCYELTQTGADGLKLLAVLDKETLYLLKTEETMSGGEAADEFSVVYEDHQNVAGIIEPHKTTLYRNGELDNTAIVTSYRINPGLVSSLFEVPDELKE